MSQVDSFVGRRVLVTGAASGIGLAIAKHFSLQGSTVVISDVDAGGLEELSKVIGPCEIVVANLAERGQVARLAKEAGHVDILVNNAGLQHVSRLEDFPEERLDTLLAVMLVAPFLLAKACLPAMYQQQWGRIVNIASVHGLVASANKGAYVVAKHGLVGLTKVIALEAAAKCNDVTAHAICPSYVRTSLVEDQIEDQSLVTGLPKDQVISGTLLAQNAVKLLIEPDDVASAVAWVCGTKAWSMTGSALTMDAGWLAH